MEMLRIVAIYALFGLAWIYGSDRILGWLVHDPGVMVNIAVIKGSLFILCTATLLYFLISRFARQLAEAERGQIESLKNYLAIFNATNEAIFVHDVRSCRILDINNRMLEMFGYTRDETLAVDIGKISEGTPPHSQAEAVEKCRKAMVEGPQVFQWLCRRKTGELFWTEVSLRKITIQGDNRIIAVVRDINERKQLDDALRKSEELQRTILQTAMSGFWRTDTHGRLIEVNESYCRMSGYSEQELLTMNVTELEADESDHDIADRIRLLMERGEARFDSLHRRKDGTVFCVEVSVKYLQLDHGQCVFFLHDITDRKQSETALKESEERWKFALEGAGDGLWDWDAVTNHVYFSRQWKAMLGYTEDEFGNTLDDWERCVHPEDIARVFSDLERHFRRETETFSNEYRIRCKDGTYKWILDRGKVIEWTENGKPRRIIGTHTDISYRKQAETEKTNLENKLQQAQKMESIGRLAGGVAHDFNNMLAVILGHTDLILMKMEDANPIRNNLLEIHSAAKRSADLTRQLLAFARKQAISPIVMNLNDAITGMLKMLQRLIGEDIYLTWQPAPDLWMVKADPSQIDQILANLCVNARDAIKSTGRITIETRNITIDESYCRNNPDAVPGEHVRFSVSDDGSGMERDSLPHIFEPFYTTKEIGKGTGLGLATVFGIVKQNNGFVNVYSEPGMGSTFSIYLPRLVNNNYQTLAENKEESIPRGDETVLLVEDETTILNMASSMLGMQGYNVLPAESPDEAIRLAREHAGAIHLLLTDVIMPNMNGKDLAKTLSSNYPDMKCLFMSGYTADIMAQNEIQEEELHFIQKPFSLSDLAFTVRNVLDA